MDASRYVGIPFKDHGRGPDGVDCWGLVRMVYRNHLDVDLPEYAGDYVSAHEAREVAALVAGERLGWTPVPIGRERPMDVVLLRVMGHPTHVGVVVEPGVFLHCLRGMDTVLESYRSAAWRKRLEGFYRWTNSN